MIIVDTNVVSKLMKPSPSASVVEWLRVQDGGELFTTSITLAEILYGIPQLPDGRRPRASAEHGVRGVCDLPGSGAALRLHCGGALRGGRRRP